MLQTTNEEIQMKEIAVIGIDLAKNIFQVHGADASGHAVLTKRLSRGQMIEFFSKLGKYC